MIDIVSVILAEYESIPFELIEILFARIIDPEKVLFVFLKLDLISKTKYVSFL